MQDPRRHTILKAGDNAMDWQQRMSAALMHIEENLTGTLSTEDIAARANCSNEGRGDPAEGITAGRLSHFRLSEDSLL